MYQHCSYISFMPTVLCICRGAPVLLGVSLYFLWQQLGWTCLPGVVYMVVIVVFGTAFASKKIIPLQVRKTTLCYGYVRILIWQQSVPNV